MPILRLAVQCGACQKTQRQINRLLPTLTKPVLRMITPILKLIALWTPQQDMPSSASWMLMQAHQISLALEAQPHNAFIINARLYCYKVMLFGLKNVGGTYKRMVNNVFNSQIGRNLDVYVDDMITKSKQAQDHAVDLRKTFMTLRNHQMRLNPDKCAFGVTGGKCLGFLVDEKGIEANPNKIQAILTLKSPRSIKEVQKVTSRVATLGKFMSKSADQCSVFFRTVKQIKFEWSKEAEEAFHKLKYNLASMAKLVSPAEGEVLILYISVSEYSISGVLVAEREKSQLLVYYISHGFRGSEGKYSEVVSSVCHGDGK